MERRRRRVKGEKENEERGEGERGEGRRRTRRGEKENEERGEGERGEGRRRAKRHGALQCSAVQ
jgi:transcription termination factor Rho